MPRKTAAKPRPARAKAQKKAPSKRKAAQAKTTKKAAPRRRPARAKLTRNEIMFAQEYIRTGDQSYAYRLVYADSIPDDLSRGAVTNRAWRLATTPTVKSYINKLRRRAMERAQVSVESLTVELDQDRAAAREAGQYGAAIRAVEQKAKLHKLLIERKDITLTALNEFPESLLDQMIEQAQEELAEFDETRH